MQSDDDWLTGLVRLAQSGDEGALSQLIARHHRHVYQTAFAILRSRSDAEEVAQDTFVRMYRKLHTLRDENAFQAWLTIAATRLAIDHSRKTRRHMAHSLDELPEATHASRADPADRVILDEALRRLSPEHLAILLLRERDGYEYSEIAKILRIPMGTVKSRLANAKQALRRQFEEKDGV